MCVCVQVSEPDGTIRELTRGDAFGVRAVKDESPRTHRGVMRTVTENCQFACVPQADYVCIMSREGEAEIPEVGEGGRVVLVYESVAADAAEQHVGRTAGISNSLGPLSPAATTALVSKSGRVVTKVG